jgi:hypothetical protein
MPHNKPFPILSPLFFFVYRVREITNRTVVRFLVLTAEQVWL